MYALFQAKIVARMIEQGWDPNTQDQKGLAVSDYALKCRDTEISNCNEVLVMLGGPRKIFSRSSDVVKAALSKDLKALKAMVPNSVSPNATIDYSRKLGHRPLLTVAIGNIEWQIEPSDEGRTIIQYLIDEGADPNSRTGSVR